MTYIAPRQAFAFFLHEVSEVMSRDEYTLKQDAVVYDVGTLVISEFAASVKTGKYVRATQTLVDAQATADFAIVSEATDATAGDALAAVFVRLGAVKGKELALDASITIPEAKALLIKQFVIVQ